MKKILFVVIVAQMGILLAAPTVTDVVAKQRYPWKGLVDITCKVEGIDATVADRQFVLSAVFPDSENIVKMSKLWVVRDGVKSNDLSVDSNGDYQFLWDARAALGEVRYTNMVVRVDIKVRQKVQLWEGGGYWATTNIGAEKPEDYGYYFWWGDTVGYKRENDKWVASDGSNSDFSFGSGNAPTSFKSNSTLQEEGWITSNGVLAPEHDAANVHWGNGWRLPTKEELDALGSNCDWIWTVKNGVNGYVVRGKGDYSSNSIFLPCAGTGDYTSASDLGSSGGCWSSVPNPSYVNGAASWFISFNLSGPGTNSYRNRWSAQSIRPVREVSSSNILSMSGLKAAYFFDGNVNDSSSSGWNLTSNGGTYTANMDGEANRAYSFNGQSERLTISHTAISQTFSFAFWFKTSATLDNAGSASEGLSSWRGNYALFPMNGGYSNLGYGIKVGTDGVVVMAHGDMYLNSHLSYISNIGSGWNHVAVTVGTDGSLSLYLNGNLVQTGTHSSSHVPQFSICPGGDVYGYYTGAMDDLLVFDRAINATEVLSLYMAE